MPDPGSRADLRQLLRAARDEVDRPTLILLVCAAVLPVVYVYQGTPGFFLAHFARLDDPLTPLYAQLWRFASVFVLFFAVPLGAGVLLAGKSPAQLGLCLGDVRAGLRLVVPALVVLAPLLWLASSDPDLQAEYPMARVATRSARLFLFYEAAYVLYYWGWEFLFRGALQIGLRPRLGLVGACMVQLLPSVLLHIGKPIGETWAAVVAAPLFGGLALRTGSFLPVFVLHYAIGVLNDVFCAWRLG